MKSDMKIWTGLGLATTLMGAGLAGCTDNAAGTDDAQAVSQSGEMGESGEGGEGGEGGENGEGGVSIADAGTNPVTYGSALAIAEAHAIAAKDAFAVGKKDEAAEMFAHPIAEVLADMDPVFEKLGVEDFKPLFGEASAAAMGDGGQADVNAKFDAIVAALRGAKEKAPDDGTSAPMVEAGVAADQIDRAISMYRQAVETKEYGPYLDGYGFYKAAAEVLAQSGDAIAAENATLAEHIQTAMDALGKAYPSAAQPEALDANVGEMTAAGSRVLLDL